jgi:hypothetical protein
VVVAYTAPLGRDRPVLLDRSVTTVPLSALWRRAVEAIDALRIESVDVLVDNDDAELVDLLTSAGFVVRRRGRDHLDGCRGKT